MDLSDFELGVVAPTFETSKKARWNTDRFEMARLISELTNLFINTVKLAEGKKHSEFLTKRTIRQMLSVNGLSDDYPDTLRALIQAVARESETAEQSGSTYKFHITSACLLPHLADSFVKTGKISNRIKEGHHTLKHVHMFGLAGSEA